MENPLAIANFFIKKSLETGIPVTNMKLVKLVYIAHGWYLGLTGQPLIGEGAEAWKYGPVIPSIYYSFNTYGGNPINQIAYTITPSGQTSNYPLSDPSLNEFLDKVWDVYSGYSAIELSAFTHQENTPWNETWNKGGGSSTNGVVIPNEAIKSHYEQLAKINMKSNAVA